MNSKNKIDIQFLRHDELENFQSFIKNHWSNKHIFAIEESIFNWQHKNKKNYNYIIAKVDNQIIGVWGVIPIAHFDNKLQTNQIFIALWRVLPGYGVAISLQIFNKIVEEYKPSFILGLPVNPDVFKFYERQKFKIFKLKHHVFISEFLKDFEVAKVPKSLKNNKINNYSRLSIKRLRIQDFKNLDTRKLYIHQIPTKTDLYIINRYIKHPIYNYKIYSIFDKNNLEGLLVVRPIYINRKTILTIVDYIGAGWFFSRLGNFMSSLIQEYDAEFIDIYSFGLDEKNIIDAGFINVDENKGLVIPGLFEPFKRKNIQINCCCYYSSQNGNIRIFKGDGDADRPSVI